MLRFQFTNEYLGPLTVDKGDPIGINSLQTTVKRSTKNEGVMWEVVVDLDFIKEARDYLLSCYRLGGGVDAVVIASIYDYDPNARRWELYFLGTANFNKRDVWEDRISIVLEQTGMQRSIMNSLDIDIDLEALFTRNGTALPDQFAPTIPFHSKTILRQTDMSTGIKEDDGSISYPEFQQLGGALHIDDLPGLDTNYRERVAYGNLATDRTTADELKETFKLPFGWVDMETMGIGGAATVSQYLTWLEANPDYGRVSEIYKATEAGTINVNANIVLKHKVEASDVSGDVDVCGDGALGTLEVHAWYELRNQDDVIQDIQHIGSWSMPNCGSRDDDNISEGTFETKSLILTGINVGIGWKVYVYETIRVYGNYHNTDIGSEDVDHNFWVYPADGYKITISNATQFQQTSSKVVLYHEAFQRACQYVSNQKDVFRSSLVGRPEIVLPDTWEPYTEDGVGALISWTNGNNIRERDKPIITTINELLQFADMAFYVGFGFEVIAGQMVLVLERRSYFYRKDQKIMSLGKVFNPKSSVAPERYANQIEYGYAGKIDIGQTNGIDEFNTTRKTSIPIVNTKNQIKVSVKTRAGGYQIEYQRRLSDKTEDGKLDDDNFVVCVIRDGDSFKTKRNEGYTAITNVFDADSGYNYDISPARCLTTSGWMEHIAAMLIRSFDKTIKFSGGEVNFLMTSQKTGETTPIAENGTFDLSSVVPIFDPEVYTLNDVPFDRNQVKLVKANPYGYIDFEDQKGNVYEGFILNIEHKPNEGKADFELLKVHRPTV